MNSRYFFITSFVLATLLSTTAEAGLVSFTTTTSNTPYQLSLGDMADGELVNSDRTHQFANLPAFMQGADYILTANDDKKVGVGLETTVVFDLGTTLLLSIDGRIGQGSGDGNTPPALGPGFMEWVVTDGWALTGASWNKAGATAVDFFVYSLNPAGTSYTFKEQNQNPPGGRDMYSIAAVPEPTTLAMTVLACASMIGLRRRQNLQA